MTEAERRLDALFAQDLPPARDAVFRLDVLGRIQRRRAMENLIAVVALGLAASVLVWSFAPQLTAGLGAVSGMILVLAGAAAAVWVAAMLSSGGRMRLFPGR